MVLLRAPCSQASPQLTSSRQHAVADRPIGSLALTAARLTTSPERLSPAVGPNQSLNRLHAVSRSRSRKIL
jgi:hypothetical protein